MDSDSKKTGGGTHDDGVSDADKNDTGPESGVRKSSPPNNQKQPGLSAVETTVISIAGGEDTKELVRPIDSHGRTDMKVVED